MKRLLFLPLLCVAAAGCRAPSTQSGGTTPGASAPASTSAQTATIDAAKAPETALQTATAPETAPKGKTYRAASGEGSPPGSEKYRLAPPPLGTKIPDKPRLVMLTSRGPITLELDAKAAPLHVRSVLYLAGKGFYNGIKFHRHADLLGNGQGFIIQGGDPLTKVEETMQFAGGGGPGYEIPREYNDLKHRKLVIAAARTSDPDSAGSQFYITKGEVPVLDEINAQSEGYTVFGRVVSGDKVALALTQGDSIKSVTLQK